MRKLQSCMTGLDANLPKSVIETSKSHEISDLATTCIILSRPAFPETIYEEVYEKK